MLSPNWKQCVMTYCIGKRLQEMTLIACWVGCMYAVFTGSSHGFALALVCTDVPDNPREGAASQPVSGQDDDTCAAEFAE